jgi:hypothetical protein
MRNGFIILLHLQYSGCFCPWWLSPSGQQLPSRTSDKCNFPVLVIEAPPGDISRALVLRNLALHGLERCYALILNHLTSPFPVLCPSDKLTFGENLNSHVPAGRVRCLLCGGRQQQVAIKRDGAERHFPKEAAAGRPIKRLGMGLII